MIYLDNGATSFRKPPGVYRAVERAMYTCANPGRGGYPAAMEASETVYACREAAAELFHCRPEQVALTTSCTHGLNIAIRSIVKPGGRVIVSGFEHNAVTRPLHALGADIRVAGRRLFRLGGHPFPLRAGIEAGGGRGGIYPRFQRVRLYSARGAAGGDVPEMAGAVHHRCRPVRRGAARGSSGAGARTLSPCRGIRGCWGLRGRGCCSAAADAQPLLFGGTGSDSVNQAMPDYLPDRLEAGTLNVPGYAGLTEGLRFVRRTGVENIFRREHRQLERCAEGLQKLGMEVFAGAHQASTVSFRPGMDCEEAAAFLAKQGIAVRAGLHCAPFAHESAGTLESGTVRVSFGHDASDAQTDAFLRVVSKLPRV